MTNKVEFPFGEMPVSNKWKVCQHRHGDVVPCNNPAGCTDYSCADRWSNENFEPMRPRPCPNHVPLIVVPEESRKKENSIVAFIGRQLAFFERFKSEDDPSNKKNILEPVPEVGKPIEVMATRVLYKKTDEGRYDHQNVLAICLRPVTGFALIRHNGFECSGSMCSTTAQGYHANGESGPWLTPGRTGIFEASNVNAGSTWKQKYVARRPGYVWVDKEKYIRGHFPLRAEGVSRIEDTEYYAWIKK